MNEPGDEPLNKPKPADKKPEWKPNRMLLLALAAACALVATFVVERANGQPPGQSARQGADKIPHFGSE